MRLPNGQHLGYCTNVHPYDSLDGLTAALRDEAAPLAARLRRGAGGRTPVPALLGEDAPLGVGLWLPASIAGAVAADPEPLRRTLADAGLYVFSVNAFPYGDFHAGRVKDDVFRPTWADERRLHYTLQAAAALAALLPEGVDGSLSTHTGGYKPWGGPAPADIARGLLSAADGLQRLRQRTGRRIVLALEPEPLSTLETAAEAAAFFERWLLPAGDVAARHLGLCYDACHQAVEYEDMAGSLQALRRTGVPIAKVQLSSALRLADPARNAAALAPFADDRWFHQVVARSPGGALRRIADLPEALADAPGTLDAEWRVHFHVPLFADQMDDRGALRTTREDLAALLALVHDPAVTSHLEIETYSFSMIPASRREALGAPTLGDCLQREFEWVLGQLAGPDRQVR
jgi:sugar phosphate isomerase/epimerase